MSFLGVSESLRAFRRSCVLAPLSENFMRTRSLIWLFASSATVLLSTAHAQTVSVQAITTSFGRKVVTPEARFGHTVGAGTVMVEYELSDLDDCLINIPAQPNPERIENVLLFEDNVRVDIDENYNCGDTQGSLTYTPTIPGEKILTVVAVRRNGSDVRTDGTPVDMFGVSIRTSLGDTAATPILPFTSRIFLEVNALLADANIKKAEFFQRSLPFKLSSGVK